MQLVVPMDTATIAKWGVTDKLPAALLVSDGVEIARVNGENGKLRLASVEDMLRNELRTRETALDKVLDEAKQKEKADHDGAVTLYQQVWDRRCLAPKKGR